MTGVSYLLNDFDALQIAFADVVVADRALAPVIVRERYKRKIGKKMFKFTSHEIDKTDKIQNRAMRSNENEEFRISEQSLL